MRAAEGLSSELVCAGFSLGRLRAGSDGGGQEALLVDPATFSTGTFEDLIDAGALPKATAASFRDRYVRTE